MRGASKDAADVADVAMHLGNSLIYKRNFSLSPAYFLPVPRGADGQASERGKHEKTVSGQKRKKPFYRGSTSPPHDSNFRARIFLRSFPSLFGTHASNASG